MKNRILIVEDESLNREWMKRDLARYGAEYVFVDSLEGVEEALSQGGFTRYMVDHHILGGVKGDGVVKFLVELGVAPSCIATIGTYIEPGYPEGIHRFNKRGFKRALEALGYSRLRG